MKYLYILILILLFAGFLRLYQIDQYMTFLGDEGRDAIIVKKILTEYDLPFIGPTTSFGNVYLGPLYYYMMAVSYLLLGINPVSGAIMVALIGVSTVYLVYYLTNRFFGVVSGLLAAWLYAISPINIIYSRSSWNPNPAPFFSITSFIFFDNFHKSRKLIWIILTGLSVGAAIQMHYLSLILILIIGILLLIEKLKGVIKSWWDLLKVSTLFIDSILFTLIPWFLFEYKHHLMNIRAFGEIFFGEKSGVGVSGIGSVIRLHEVLVFNLLGEYLTRGNLVISLVIILLILDFIHRGRKNWGYLLLTIWLVIGLIGVSLYKGNIYSHYLGFLNPSIFILLGSGWYFLNQKLNGKTEHRKYVIYGKVGFLIFIAIISYLNLVDNPLRHGPQNQLQRTKDIAKFVAERSEGRDFNFALLAKNNYDSAYQFYLEEYGARPKVLPFNKTDQLFVVCEDADCNPPYSPKHEIAAFGMSKIETQTEFNGVKVFKLIPNPSGKP